MLRLAPGLLVAAACASPLGAAVIARDGQPAIAIAVADRPTPPERFAADELVLHLKKITGGAFEVVKEGKLRRGRAAIFVGHTRFAVQSGVDVTVMGEEESLARTVGDSLILTGGRPRGTLYAVYEFLERDLDVAWLSPDVSLIPDLPDLEVTRVDRKRSPALARMRWIYSSQRKYNNAPEFLRKAELWSARNRVGAAAWLWGDDTRMGVRRKGWPGLGHSFYTYLPPEEHFEKHPEWYSLSTSGTRMRQHGQLCLTNTAMRKAVVGRMREAIAQDRARAADENRPHPVLYDLGMNDHHNMCQCEPCREVVRRSGAESGLVLEFVNAVADEIGRDYPDVIIWTFAYSLTIHPPANMRPRDNVMIQLAYLAPDNWRDPTKPLTHPANAEHRAATEGWARLASRIRVWDYWRLFMGDPFDTPYTRVRLIQGDVQYLRGLGIRDGQFADFSNEDGLSFGALTRWLGLKLMDDPDQDAEASVRRFMRAWYGPAAEPMEEWLDYLTQSLADSAESLTAVPVFRRSYMNLAFFQDAYEILDRAERTCEAGSPELARVRGERLPVDTAVLGLWDTLAAGLGGGGAMPWDRERVLDRYIADKREVVRHRRIAAKVAEALDAVDDDEARLRLALAQPELPGAFGVFPSRDVVDVLREASWDNEHMGRRVIDDPSAPGGVAVRLAKPEDQPGTEVPFGLYCHPKRWGPQVTLVPAGVRSDGSKDVRVPVPRDEAYHWYRLGPYRVTPGSILFAHRSWHMSLKIDRPLMLGYPEEDWYAFVALKLEGPAYVRGSKKENALSVGRIVLVRAASRGVAGFMPGD
ncbi:MAG TPA: DUF4838 domain-containing protein [Armatimonadota bacterium]|nr:DUF4838 domain-containing protein [Armatimonadota bacterium]